MILIPAYYAIKPTVAFKEKLANLDLDPDLVDILSETVFWNYHRAGDTEDDIIEVKLLFIANLMSEYLPTDLYKKILEQSCISLEVFDKWWTLERYFVDETFSDVEKRIEPSVGTHFVKTGRKRVDLWIDEIQKKA
ncbi:MULTISPECIES: hypothetical protein [Cyanophyceae]|uniref:hypothetical protein n=1 Tax=Cyanophyceae TaxID=3028117 RepID=UPI001684C090|nr:hypothetical protein [Trichocoleus sp. FACHB-40]MBD2004121.1 hypothetical protein [Trichocoleus sp. FACHB-40]